LEFTACKTQNLTHPVYLSNQTKSCCVLSQPDQTRLSSNAKKVFHVPWPFGQTTLATLEAVISVQVADCPDCGCQARRFSLDVTRKRLDFELNCSRPLEGRQPRVLVGQLGVGRETTPPMACTYYEPSPVSVPGRPEHWEVVLAQWLKLAHLSMRLVDAEAGLQLHYCLSFFSLLRLVDRRPEPRTATRFVDAVATSPYFGFEWPSLQAARAWLAQFELCSLRPETLRPSLSCDLLGNSLANLSLLCACVVFAVCLFLLAEALELRRKSRVRAAQKWLQRWTRWLAYGSIYELLAHGALVVPGFRGLFGREETSLRGLAGLQVLAATLYGLLDLHLHFERREREAGEGQAAASRDLVRFLKMFLGGLVAGLLVEKQVEQPLVLLVIESTHFVVLLHDTASSKLPMYVERISVGCFCLLLAMQMVLNHGVGSGQSEAWVDGLVFGVYCAMLVSPLFLAVWGTFEKLGLVTLLRGFCAWLAAACKKPNVRCCCRKTNGVGPLATGRLGNG